MRLRCTVIGLLAITTGCVTDAAPGDDPTGASDGKADGAGGAALAHTYALELTSNMKLEDTRETDPAKRYSDYALRTRAQVTTTVTGDDVQLAVKLCDVRLPIVQGYQPELDPAFVTALAPIAITGKLAHDGGLSLHTAPAALVLGAALANPIADALPATATDGRVRDADHDGNPGVSIQIPGHGKIYSAMRVLLSIHAPVTAPGAIAGDAQLQLDQVVYGDDIWFFDAVQSFADSQQYVHVLSATNRFRMRGDIGTCAGVVSTYP
jgi:hypothetical protein